MGGSMLQSLALAFCGWLKHKPCSLCLHAHMSLFGFCLLDGASDNTAHIKRKQRQMKKVDKKSIETFIILYLFLFIYLLGT